MDCGGEDAIGVTLEELTHVADEGVGDGSVRNPLLCVGIQDFESRDTVLPDQSNPYIYGERSASVQ